MLLEFGAVHAQDVYFERLTQNEGLPSPTVTSIIKDSYGFMWLGSRRGLVKYDGYEYKTFDLESTVGAEKISNYFFSDIEQINDSILLMSLSYEDFYEFNIHTERFNRIRPPNEGALQENCIYSIYQDHLKRIWLGSSNGLQLYNHQTKRLKNFPVDHFPQFAGIKNAGVVNDIIEDRLGRLWLYLANGHVGIFNPRTESFEFIKYYENKFDFNLINHGGNLLFDSTGILWIGTEYDGIFSLDTSSNNVNHYSTQNGKITSDVIRDFCLVDSNEIWVATDGGGVLKFDPIKDAFIDFQNNPNDPSSLSGNAIYVLYYTQEGIMWIGTYAAGVNLYKKNKSKFKKYTTTGESGKCLSSKSVLSFEELPNGLILIGTDGGGLNVQDPKTGEISFLTTANSSLHSDVVTSLYLDTRGYLWIGSYGKGVCRYRYEKELIRASPVLLDGESFWSITEDKEGRLWLGSLNRVFLMSIALDDYSNDIPQLLFENNCGAIKYMYLDSNGRVWLCTSSNGLCYYDFQKGFLKSMQFDDSRPNSIPSNNVTSFIEDNYGQFWVGTQFGDFAQLIDFDENTVKLFPTGTIDFNSVNGILEDREGILWLSTDNGIINFSEANGMSHFGLDDGVQSKEFNIGACFKGNNGQMYFGGIEGFNSFLSSDVLVNLNTPRVYITDLRLFNKSLKQAHTYGDRIYLNKAAFATEVITLDFKDNVFSASFVSLDYFAPEANLYEYKLEGFDKDWVSCDASKRVLTYTNLPPGEYNLIVRGSNNDGVWNEVGANLKIKILPPWWMTMWFRGLLLILTLSLITGVYYLRLRNIKRKNLQLAQLVKVQTAELHEVNDELKETNEEVLITNEKLEAQNLELHRKSNRIQEQQQRIIKQNSELEESNLSLNELNETKDKFFSIIAHDLRNPVGAIYSLSELLAGNFKTYPDVEKEQFVQQIYQSSAQLKKLTSDLLDWAASQTKHYKAHFMSVNLHAVVNESIVALDLQSKQKNILVSNEVDPLHVARIDAKMLTTVFRNLISNSIKFSDQGSVITLMSKVDGFDKVTVSVTDHGVGMSELQLNKLFQSDTVTSSFGTNEEAGAGLGLVICNEFIKLNQGRLLVESELGKGTTVNVEMMPCDVSKKVVQVSEPYKIETTTDRIEEIRSYAGRKILVIDDDPGLRKALMSYLSDSFEVYVAENGKNGLEIAQKVYPELVVCDLNMPVMNGFEFCTLLKKDPQTSHIGCIVLTGQTEFEVEKRALEAGANGFLTKPYDPYLLMRRIVNQLEVRDQIQRKFATDESFVVADELEDTAQQAFILACVNFINEHMANPELHADDLCKELGMSKTLLYEKIKSITGQTVNEFIKLIRLKHSLELLKQRKLNISQIALEVGFNSLSYYTRTFTKQYGKSPSEYMKYSS